MNKLAAETDAHETRGKDDSHTSHPTQLAGAAGGRCRRTKLFFAALFVAAINSVAATWSRISGRVCVDETCLPAACARVGVQNSAQRVYADSAGRFRLPRPAYPGARIVASAHGHFIGAATWNGERHVEITLRKHPTENSPDYQWLDPGPNPANDESCANCHAETYRQWSASSHARSAVNRNFLDVFNGTDWDGTPDVGWNFSRDHPEARAVCAACHVPTVHADSPVAEDPARAAGVTREGIHCDFCHKISGTDFSRSLDALGLQHGRDALQFVRPAGGQQIFFGPLDDVDRGRDVFSPLYKSSLYCASCHEGTLFGTRAYETFSEWRTSSYARRGVECQHCHMKSDGVTRNVAPGHGGIERHPATLSTHHFPGAIDQEFLRSSVELTISSRVENELVHVVATVRPVNVGHWLPTGSPDRHLLLVVRAADETGRELALRSGPTIPAAGGVGPREPGNLAGSPGKLFGKLLRGADGTVPAPFWQAVAVESDTRLRPDSVDQSQFTFRPPPTGPARVTATLFYRKFYESARLAKGWPTSDVLLSERTAEVFTP